MLLSRWAFLIPLTALAACGGGTIRVADDSSSTDAAPVSLAPTPDSEPDTSAAAAPAPAPEPPRDTIAAAATAPRAKGYSAYGGGAALEIRRIGQWSRTGIGEGRRLVIRDANSWASFWSELGTGDRPDVDFTKAVVVAVAAGQRPSGGYEIAVDQVSQTDGELTVQVVEISPGPNCLTSAAPTQPVDVVVVPVVAPRSWSFLERKEVRGCR
jgi:protease stability complex PrcB-like protein